MQEIVSGYDASNSAGETQFFYSIKKEGTPASFRLKMATIVAIPNKQQVTADEDRGRLVRRP